MLPVLSVVGNVEVLKEIQETLKKSFIKCNWRKIRIVNCKKLNILCESSNKDIVYKVLQKKEITFIDLNNHFSLVFF